MLFFKPKLTFGLLMAILIFTSVVLGYTDVSHYGQNQYHGGRSIFNVLIDGDADITYSIASPHGQPLVADVDNDGTNEIMVINGNSIAIFNYSSGIGLSVEKSCSLPAGTYNFMEIYDIDGDGYREIITQTEKSSTQVLSIMEYNGTACFNQTSFSTSMPSHIDAWAFEEILISCGGVNNCLLIRTKGGEDDGYPTSTTAHLYAQLFNSTGTIGSYITLVSGSASWDYPAFVFPHSRSITYSDYDDDATYEWVFSAMRTCIRAYGGDVCSSSDNEVYVFTLYNNVTNVADDGVSFSIDVLDGGEGENGGYVVDEYYTTGVSVYDYDPSQAGEEMVLGFMYDDDEFSMVAYDRTGTLIDTFPQASQADGVIVSNVVRGNFIEGDDNAFCVMGANSPEDEIDILCGSLVTNFALGVNNVEFAVEGIDYLLSNNTNVINNMIYSIQSSSSTLAKSNFNADEVLAPFGVIQLTDDGLLCSSLGYCTGYKIYGNIYQNSAVISVDYENISYEDIVELNDDYNLLVYRDDGFENTNAQLEQYCLNPCTDGQWKVNTSISLYSVTPIDTDGDEVRARAILYYGEGNTSQDSNWTTYSASGTPFSFSFVSNVTTSASTLRIIVQDIEHTDENVTEDITFSVGTTGLEYGSCSSCETLIVEGEEEEGLSTDSTGDTYQNNTITGGLLNLTETLGFGVGIKAMWLFMMIMGMLMIVVSGVMYFGHGATNLIIIACLVCFFEVMMVILGFYFSIFGWGTIILLFLSAVAIISLLILRQIVTGGG